ncbi:MAG TPA: ABC transporter ATP-binding protein [Holophaga sp.]|nr:ABC transporter ATP-binding protein [Holophaga sp.]HPS67234.1 ABC transporter ATP-binding protein [Holophaga sp.]
MSTDPILNLDNIHVDFPVGSDWRGRPKQYVHALNGIDLAVWKGETLGIVGESGCGKSTLAQVLMSLVRPTQGALRRRRPGESGAQTRMQIVFQDPQSSLNPRLPVWKVIAEPYYIESGRKASRSELMEAARKAATLVEIPPEYLSRFPHEFSGGQRQRIAIARALVSEPDLILLDEPTSALDISVQAQILNLLNELQKQRGLTYILISHNVAVVKHMSDRIAVMYLGQIVELGATAEVMKDPKHPYTRLLLESVPRLGVSIQDDEVSSNMELPSNRHLPAGCFFKDRCPLACEGCGKPQELKERPSSPGHLVRCHLKAD